MTIRTKFCDIGERLPYLVTLAALRLNGERIAIPRKLLADKAFADSLRGIDFAMEDDGAVYTLVRDEDHRQRPPGTEPEVLLSADGYDGAIVMAAVLHQFGKLEIPRLMLGEIVFDNRWGVELQEVDEDLVLVLARHIRVEGDDRR